MRKPTQFFTFATAALLATSVAFAKQGLPYSWSTSPSNTTITLPLNHGAACVQSPSPSYAPFTQGSIRSISHNAMAYYATNRSNESSMIGNGGATISIAGTVTWSPPLPTGTTITIQYQADRLSGVSLYKTSTFTVQ